MDFLFRSCLSICITLVFFTGLLAQSYEDYDWKHVPIGGGGYITGMKIHPMDATKRYYRTDVGGAYRWNHVKERMEQMIFLDNKNLYSVAGIALDPSNTNLVYLAVGRNCASSQTAILKSTNGGVDFTVLNIPGLPFWFAANGGRECDTNLDTNGANNKDKDRQGTPLEVNPHNKDELYIGTREKGLYILNLATNNLTQISGSEVPYNSDQYSIRSVVFHPTELLVYVAYHGNGVYVGEVNVADPSFTRYGEMTNTQLRDAIDISISKDADYLLVACKTQGIMKATNLGGALSWEKLTGLNDADDEGYLTADCSPHVNDVAITVVADWNHINEFQVTTNGGSTWKEIDGSVDPDDNIFKWRNDAFASHVSQIAFDPADSNKMYYTSWFSSFACDNFTLKGPNSWHSNYSAGHEEIVPTDLVAFPTNVEGNFLMAGSGDHSGFLFDNNITDPNKFASFHIAERATTPVAPLKKAASMDFCEKNSDNLVVCISEEWGLSNAGILTSDNGGLDWVLHPGYDTASNHKSIVAMSSDEPDNIIALSNNGMQYIKPGSTNFSQATGASNLTSSCTVPFNFMCKGATDFTGMNINPNVFGAFRNIAADKNYKCVFYYYDWDGDGDGDGVVDFSITTDGGANWCVVNDNTLPASTNIWEKTRLISIPGHDGHLWININNQLWHSINAGVDWANYSSQQSVDKVKALSFGKGFNNAYEALYIYGSIDGVAGDFFYRSDDIGITWTRINEHAEKESWGDNKMIAGDRNVAGRLYATASGQGVVYGDVVSMATCDNAEKTIEGEFSDINSPNIPDWVVSQIGGGVVNGTINPWNKAVLAISNPGMYNYDLQLWQDNLSMEVGKLYLIQVDLRSDNDRSATIKLRNKPIGTTYIERTVNVGATAQVYSFLFKPLVTDNDLRLTLMVGGDDNDVYIDYIRFREYCEGDQALINCSEYIRLDDHDIVPNNYHAAIEVSSDGLIPNNTNSQFISGEQVYLDPGFEVELGAILLIDIEDCP